MVPGEQTTQNHGGSGFSTTQNHIKQTWHRICNHTKSWWYRIFNHTKSYHYINSLVPGPNIDTKLNRLQLQGNHKHKSLTIFQVSLKKQKPKLVTNQAKMDHQVLLLVLQSLMGIGPSYLKELLSMKTVTIEREIL